MNDRPRDWVEYWDQDRFWSHSELWKINAALFYRRFRRLVELKPTDTVANIGCGPGYLERLLAPEVKVIHAFDTSRQFVEMCREHCRHHPNVQVSLLDEDYTNLQKNCHERFSLILCVSVVQYYPHPGKVEELIESARAIALPGARMLIADLPQPRGLWGHAWDAWCSLVLSLREGYAPILLRTVWDRGSARSAYRAFQKNVPELEVPIGELRALIQRMKLNATIISTGLSIYANRPSLLIQW